MKLSMLDATWEQQNTGIRRRNTEPMGVAAVDPYDGSEAETEPPPPSDTTYRMVDSAVVRSARVDKTALIEENARMRILLHRIANASMPDWPFLLGEIHRALGGGQ